MSSCRYTPETPSPDLGGNAQQWLAREFESIRFCITNLEQAVEALQPIDVPDPAQQFINFPEKLIPVSNTQIIGDWYTDDGLSVIANGTFYDLEDDDATDAQVGYESLQQLSPVAQEPVDNKPHYIEMLVGKDPNAEFHFVYLQVVQYNEYTIGGSNTAIASNSMSCNLITGEITPRLNPGGFRYFSEDLVAENAWKWVMEFDRRQTATIIRTFLYPAGGKFYPVEAPSAVGIATFKSCYGWKLPYTG